MTEIGFERDILEALRDLPQDKQKEVADYIEFLRNRTVRGVNRRVKGLWSKYQIDITSEDLNKIRQNMWSSFPREIE